MLLRFRNAWCWLQPAGRTAGFPCDYSKPDVEPSWAFRICFHPAKEGSSVTKIHPNSNSGSLQDSNCPTLDNGKSTLGLWHILEAHEHACFKRDDCHNERRVQDSLLGESKGASIPTGTWNIPSLDSLNCYLRLQSANLWTSPTRVVNHSLPFREAVPATSDYTCPCSMVSICSP